MGKMVSQNLDFSEGNNESDIMLDTTKVQSYKDKLRLDVIGKAKTALDDIDGIVDAVSRNWNGTSAQNFITALENNVTTLKEKLDEVEKGMEAVVDLARDTILKQDNDMISTDFGVF